MAADETSSDEWFVRYMVQAGALVLLTLTAMAVSWYIDGADSLAESSDGPDPAFLVCAVLCPVLGIVALSLFFYAGIRLLLRPHTFEHVLLRFVFLLAHAGALMISFNASAALTSNLLGGVEQWLLQDMGVTTQPWSATGADRTGSQYDVRDGSPDDYPSSPSRMAPGPSGPLGPSRRR